MSKFSSLSAPLPFYLTFALPSPLLPYSLSSSHCCRSESCGIIHYTGKTGKLGVVPFYFDPEEQEVEFGDRVQFMIAKVKRTKEQRAVALKILQRQRDVRFKVRWVVTPAKCTVHSVLCFS